ncbi:Cilia- and flagella-associated protein 43 [Phlyctochytrium planicorne]|nr:Cilia- and flagella-associated protein 43 [Phlyctochytrium planicorne]
MRLVAKKHISDRDRRILPPHQSNISITTHHRDDVEFVKPFAKKHAQRSSIQHWQLRDLISCPRARNEFVYVNQNNVFSYNTETKENTALLKDLTFSPTSMTAGLGYLAAGGQRSQLIVRQLNSTWFAQTTVGGSINNAMCLSSHQGQTRLMICNNDETIKVYALPSLQRITSVSLPIPVNYCSVSPDGRKLAAVGDSNQVYLFDVTPSGNYQRVAVMTATNDAGFSCAWNQTSDKFAVASQDGYVCVWDIRSTEKLAKLGSKQNPQVKGACRSVKFSPSGSIDLLLYSEHVSYVNLVDARTFNERQTLRVAPPHSDQHISGIGYSPDSKNIFVGLESTVLEYEVDTMRHTPKSSPVFIGPSTLCYVSGSSINFFDTEAARPQKPGNENGAEEEDRTVADITKIKGMTHLRPIVADAQITAFAVLSREGIVAYSEQGSTNIRLLKWPNLTLVVPGSGYLQADPKDLGIVALSFSFDGKYLASLSDLPQFTVSIWDWKSNNLICAEPNRDPARYISFNPTDSKKLCTSGSDGHIKFWDLEVGYKRSALKAISGMGTVYPENIQEKSNVPVNIIDYTFGKEEEKEPIDISADRHMWIPDHKVLVCPKSGDRVVLFDSRDGTCITFLEDVILKPAEKQEESVPVEGTEEEAAADPESEALPTATVEAKEKQPVVEEKCESKFRCLLLTKKNVIVGGDDGILRFYKTDGTAVPTQQITVSATGKAIESLNFSPDYKEIAVGFSDTSIISYSITDDVSVTVSENQTGSVTAICPFYLTNIVIAAFETGEVKFFDVETRSILRTFKCAGVPSCVSASVFAPVVAIGSTNGVMRIYDAESVVEKEPRLIYRKRLFDTDVKKLLFDPTGHYLSVIGSSSEVYLFDMFSYFSHIGYFTVPHKTISVAWDLEDIEDEGNMENNPVNIVLLVLTTSSSSKTSLIYRYAFPMDSELKPSEEDDLLITSIMANGLSFRADDVATDFAPVAADVSTSKGSFYLMSSDKHLKLYSAPSSSSSANTKLEEPVFLGGALFEYLDHELPGGKIALSITRDWLYTWGPDGYLTARTLMEPDKSVKVYGHDYKRNGVKDIAISRDSRNVYSIGDDGLLRVFEWRGNTTTIKRALLEASTAAEASIEAQAPITQAIVANLARLETLPEDTTDSVLEKKLQEFAKEVKNSDGLETTVQETQYGNKLLQIKEKIIALMQKNEVVPELERLTKDDFIIDFAERDRLLALSEAKVKEVRRGIEEENLKKRVIRNRLKIECWDSMEVIGQSVKSFRPDPVTTRTIEVTNFPISKRSEEEKARVARIKLLRKVQLLFAFATKPKKNLNRIVDLSDEIDDGAEANPEQPKTAPAASEPFKLDSKAMLYDPLELTTNERRRFQMTLLKETEFNNKFKDFVKLKSDEIIKIEDKNERILAIINELQITETIFHPSLDEDEVPERIIKVDDSEVKVEKFVSAEERKKLEELKRQEEERMKANQEDNYRERALMVMMGGKLEDRSEETEKEDLVRPDWMNKPKEEMSDDERKLLKEFEKKVAILKEEQEKYRKALETELKKLQSVISDICDGFDQKLRELFNAKLDADQEIYKNELKIIKLGISVIQAEGDEAKESEIISKLEALKAEKTRITSEIPDIKKDVEKCRDDFDAVLKKDKEIERQFKKEFHSGDSTFETLFKLFKLRETVTEQKSPGQVADDSFSPFSEYDKTIAVPEEPIRALDMSHDCPEGLPNDLWNRLVEARERKIGSEAEVKFYQKQLHGAQQLYQSVLDENEKIRKDIEKTNGEMAAFLEYKFQSTYNSETLFELKQGQVEVPQAPVVTDYTDSVLLHRNVVEKVNDNIITLGKSKVDALREMKEYRKGIHALEWENKMLDFQAEDLVIRTRDIQLLRVTKQMQEYIRGGDEHKQSSEITALEKRAEYSQKAHAHKLEELMRIASKFEKKIRTKERENVKLEVQERDLDIAVGERSKIRDVQAKRMPDVISKDDKLKNIYTRRRLIDLAKSQAQDIAILREEVERLRLRTYPAFPTIRRPDLF